MSFPGSEKNKMEIFIHYLYQERGGKKLSKQELIPPVQEFKFAPDEQVFFEQLPEGNYDEAGLIKALNEIMQRRGRGDAMGGLLEKRDRIPPEWEEAYRKEYANTSKNNQQNAEGVNSRQTGNKDMERDYDQSDIEVVFRRGNWESWDQAIQWLEQEGEGDNELTPGEVIAMSEDLRQIKQQGTQFTRNPQKVFEMAHKNRVQEGGK